MEDPKPCGEAIVNTSGTFFWTEVSLSGIQLEQQVSAKSISGGPCTILTT
jgi:hypothetical protein